MIRRSPSLWLSVLTVSGLALAQRGTGPTGPPPAVQRPTESIGSLDFIETCGVCHGRTAKAPPVEVLQKLTPERIYESMTTGSMKTHAARLPDATKVQIAEWVGGRKLGLGINRDARGMSNVCRAHEPVRRQSASPAWNGWSADGLTNRRFQDAQSAGITPESAPRLELRWAFGLPGASSAYGQPTVYDGRVFIGSDSGYMYSLDARTGCVYWSFQAQAGLRSTPMLGPANAKATKMAAFFGDIRGNVYSVDAASGELLWKVSAESHPMARITAGVKVHNGRVYVPLASMEEPGSGGYDYDCCTARGSVVALDAATGKQIWKPYTISEKPTRRTTSSGVPFLGPSGAGVWGAVTLDPKRRALYVSTGNAFSAPDVGRSDAVIAMHLDSGKILWVQQVEQGDVWHRRTAGAARRRAAIRRAKGSAARSPASSPRPRLPRPPVKATPRGGTGERPAPPPHYYCAEEPNAPDWDFAAGVMLVDLPDGRNLVVAGQKSGVV